MAIFHFNAKIFTRTNGDNAVAASAYRAGQRLTCERTGLVFNYSRKREVSHREIRMPAGSPAWSFDRSLLWNQVERTETRTNSQLAREIEVALPLELSELQQLDLLRGYIDEQFVAVGMGADFAVHAKKGNPHAHIMLTLRAMENEGFGAKRRDWNDPSHVTSWRAAWAEHCNRALEAAGSDVKIDHRSLVDQGSDFLPTKHVGRAAQDNCSEHDERLEWNALITARNELQRIQAEERGVRAQLTKLLSDIKDLVTRLAKPRQHPAKLNTQSNHFVALGEHLPPSTLARSADEQHTLLLEKNHVAFTSDVSDSPVLSSTCPYPTGSAGQ